MAKSGEKFDRDHAKRVFDQVREAVNLDELGKLS